MEPNTISEMIEKNPFLYEMMSNCPYEILKHWELKSYSIGDIICHQGYYDGYFSIIIMGHVNIYYLAENSKKYCQAIYSKGNYLGELEVFDEKPYSCFAEALTETTTIRLRREYFIKWLQGDDNLCMYLLRTLCELFYSLSQKAGEDALYPLKTRLCRYLITQVQRTGNGKSSLAIKKDQISENLAVTSRSINRVLRELGEKGIIEIKPGTVVINNIKQLIDEEESSREDK